MANEDVKRVSVNFSESAYDDLKKLADSQGLTVSEALRRAIALNKWFIETQKDSSILVEDRNGKVREILRLY
jgi:predicted transcriptional regulator